MPHSAAMVPLTRARARVRLRVGVAEAVMAGHLSIGVSIGVAMIVRTKLAQPMRSIP
jgi:hypothetical protein